MSGKKKSKAKEVVQVEEPKEEVRIEEQVEVEQVFEDPKDKIIHELQERIKHSETAIKKYEETFNEHYYIIQRFKKDLELAVYKRHVVEEELSNLYVLLESNEQERVVLNGRITDLTDQYIKTLKSLSLFQPSN